MAVRIQIRRGTAAEWAAANPVLMEGELGVELDTGKWKTGDGFRAWSDLDYVYDAGAVDALQSDLAAHKGAASPHSGHATTTALSTHLADLANPHAVTAAQIPYTSTVVGFDSAFVAAGLDVLAGSRIVDHNLDVVDPPNGYYARWENGLQICCHTLSGKPSAANERQDAEWNFPASFASSPTFVSVKAMGRPEDYDQIDVREVRFWSNTRLHYSWSTSAGGLHVHRTLLAIGRWK